MLGPDVAVEAGVGGEPLATLGAAQRRGGAGRRRRRRVGAGGVRLAVSLQERHPTEPPTALLALRPHPPPLLLPITREQSVTRASAEIGSSRDAPIDKSVSAPISSNVHESVKLNRNSKCVKSAMNK